jgi:glycosyltransferase involved in cell wall biosynthesis
MPEVLLLFEYPSLSGGERSMLAALGGPREAGFRFAAVVPPRGPLAAALASHGVRIHPFSWAGQDGTRRDLETLRGELASTIASLGPDLLHAASLSMSRLSGPVASRAGIPSLGHLRDILKLPAAAVADLARHTRLLAVSQAVRDRHAASGIPGDRIHVLPNGVDLETFRPRPSTGFLHRELGLPREARLVASIGQIGMRKGVDVLVDAARRVARSDPRTHFVFAGERWSRKEEAVRYEEEVRAAAREVPGGRFRFLGLRDDVDRLLGEAVLLVHAARQEPLGRVLLEAAASGVAVVATDVGGTREIFPPGSGTARLVPPDDALSLADAIRETLRDDAARAAMGKAARRRAEEAFDARAAGKALARHYREVLAAGDDGSRRRPDPC